MCNVPAECHSMLQLSRTSYNEVQLLLCSFQSTLKFSLQQSRIDADFFTQIYALYWRFPGFFCLSVLLLVTLLLHETETKWQKRHPEGKTPLGRRRQNGRIRLAWMLKMIFSVWVWIGWLTIGSIGEFSVVYNENEGHTLPKKENSWLTKQLSASRNGVEFTEWDRWVVKWDFVWKEEVTSYGCN